MIKSSTTNDDGQTVYETFYESQPSEFVHVFNSSYPLKKSIALEF